ncbi:MAG TPA: hypothetical protein VNN80_13365, partial [Polyangiaceae bacterium]|nr:hypothetical protein [Polyangiaceae bacterium]
YAASAPMIPIKLTAVAANQDMGVMTWTLSSARAVPMNYNALELNEARINWFNAASNYEQVVTEAADEAGGQGFVTEFAGPSELLDQVVWSAADESQWSSIRTTTYPSLDQMFDTLYANYQGYSGFWDAVRRTVTLPAGVEFADFQLCPTCYGEPEYSPSALLTAIDEDVLEPLRAVQGLIGDAPYATRLYSTLSAAEMTVDPVFTFNPDLPAVDNIHRANRVIECDPDLYESEAPWRIDFPQGTTIRGSAADVGSWPGAVAAQPPNLRVLSLSSSGEGAVLADNTATIVQMLDTYNAGIPSPDGHASGGLCSLPPGARSSTSGPLALALGAVLGVTARRRRRVSRGARRPSH